MRECSEVGLCTVSTFLFSVFGQCRVAFWSKSTIRKLCEGEDTLDDLDFLPVSSLVCGFSSTMKD